MLAKNIMQRVYKLANIKAHPWFQSFSWENLINMTTPPPLKPRLKKEDLTNAYSFPKYVKVMKENLSLLSIIPLLSLICLICLISYFSSLIDFYNIFTNFLNFN